MNTSILTLKPGTETASELDREGRESPWIWIAGPRGRWLPLLLGMICGLAGGENRAADFTAPDQLRKQLYYTEADNSGLYPKAGAAFRYKELLYGAESNKVRANFTNIANLYGTAERQRAAAVEEIVWGKLTSSTNDAAYGPLLLDLYYDRAAAETILARNLVEAAGTLRYGPPLAPNPPANGFYIDNEIPAYANAVGVYRAALSNYFGLFSRTRTAHEPPNAPVVENPGTEIFKSGVPGRGLSPARYINNGVAVSVTGDNTPLFSGYKDLVLVQGLLRDYGRAAETLVRLYIARGAAGDLAAARQLVTDAQRTVYVHGHLLRGLFPALDAGSISGSGLAESQAGWEKALSTLDQLRQFLDGKANLLGFAPDFLMLIQGTNHSFNSFKSLLDVNSSTSPLKVAVDALAAARGSYAVYRGFEDQLAGQLTGITSAAEGRLAEIVGQYPYPGGDDTPLAGSEADQQLRSIQIARLQIERNRVEIRNLNGEIEIEIERRGRERGVNNAIATVQIGYGNRQANLTEEIALIEAKQAYAEGLAAEANSESPFGAFFHGANAVYQFTAELDKGQLEASKERLAAKESAEITALNDQLLDINSKALIKTRLLDMNKLAVDSQEAALHLAQEQGRLVALAREKANLEGTIAESDASLSTRYFADPVHRLSAQSDLVRADLAFAEAQQWLFFMARALEYKWNKGMTNYPYLGRTWSSSTTVFMLRNAEELLDYYNALVAYEFPIEATVPGAKTVLYDWFSVREDFFGLIAGSTYVDAASGQVLDATNAFRARLQSLVRTNLPGVSHEIILKFDTVRQIPGGSFFLGPRFNGTNLIAGAYGSYVDKIQTIKIRLVGGNFNANSPPVNNARLTYGGTSVMRKQKVGQFDAARPDRLRNEMSAHSTRYYYNDGFGWRFVEALTIPFISLEKSPDPLAPPTAGLTPEFAERSVAATGWELDIPLLDLGSEVLRIEDLDDIRIYFVHSSRVRLP